MQCTDDANEFCGAGNLNSVYILPGAGVPKGCTASVCPDSISDATDPNRLYLWRDFIATNGVLYCGYLDPAKGVEDECAYDSVRMHL
jgi:hypothetical protein